MSDDMTEAFISRRRVLKKISAGGATLAGGIAVNSSEAAAADGNGAPYCHEGYSCNNEFPRGERVIVSSSYGLIGTHVNCCTVDRRGNRCPDAGYRKGGVATGTVRATCVYGPINDEMVLVEWDSDGEESHIAGSYLNRI